MDWEKLVHFYLFRLPSKISSFSKPFLAFPSALMPGVMSEGRPCKILLLNFISPNFGYEKLESATYEDLVDVFQDRIKNWFLMPAERLLEIPHCQVAAVALLMVYFEGIAIYLSGEDSKNKSFEFFAKGLSKVFPIQHEDENAPIAVQRAIYNQLRCGFAHDGMFRNRVFFSDVPSKPIIISFPKKNGILDTTQIESIVINTTAKH